MSWRYELKYLLDVRRNPHLRSVLRANLLPAEFVGPDGSYPVLSQYYDGEKLPFYLDKVAGVERRIKIRLRTYAWSFDVPASASQGAPPAPWFLEMKRKENASISKLRLTVEPGSLDPLRPASWNALPESGGPFVRTHELLRLQPTAQIWYQRVALTSAAGDLRVTFDEDVRALYPGEPMTTGVLYDRRRAILGDTLTILEIKTAQSIPGWLARLVRDASLVPEAVSKYVLGVNALELSRKVLNTC